MNFWNNFAAKHPAAAKWVREGGLFVIVSNLITVFKYLLLQFLPKAFASLPVVDFGCHDTLPFLFPIKIFQPPYLMHFKSVAVHPA